MIWNSNSLSAALNIKVNNKLVAHKVQFNSLDISPGDIFIALPGNRDGHLFVQDAINRGAAIAIIDKNVPGVDPKYLILVDDSFEALKKMACYKRQKSKAKFIAITGSVGKTTTREIIKILLSKFGNIHTSIKNFNNLLGVLLTLSSMDDNTDYVVIELGMNAPGEIYNLTKIVKPDIAIITNISENHIGSFPNIESIADAKSEIFDGLSISKGIALINRDMDNYNRCIKYINNLGIKNVHTFGYHQGATARIINFQLISDFIMRMNIHISPKEFSIDTAHIAKHLAFNFIIGFLLLNILDLDIKKCLSLPISFQPLIGRGKLVKTKYENKLLNVICDYYNSGPQSLKASINYLREFSNNRKLAFLGDMKELGSKSIELHMKLIPIIIDSGISELFLIGEYMAKIASSISKDITVYTYTDVEELIESNNYSFKDNDVILIKGSRYMKLEKVAQNLGVKDDIEFITYKID